MFTGLIEEVGQIAEIRPRAGGQDLIIRAPRISPELATGESVSINGACLTVEEHNQTTFTAHAGKETLRRTTLGEARSGVLVNLERALRPESRLGGHFVQGHVDGVGTVRGCRRSGSTVWMEFESPPELMRYIAAKGSIAVDGISLTVVDCSSAAFVTAIIPHTFEHTTLRVRRLGDRVNLEVDILAKYVEKLLTPHRESGGELTEEFLRKHGFY